MAERRWRQVAKGTPFDDEAWQFEEKDDAFVAEKYRDNSQTDVDGWRPLAAVWDVGEDLWRAQLIPDPQSNRDYRSLAKAKTCTEARLQRAYA